MGKCEFWEFSLCSFWVSLSLVLGGFFICILWSVSSWELETDSLQFPGSGFLLWWVSLLSSTLPFELWSHWLPQSHICISLTQGNFWTLTWFPLPCPASWKLSPKSKVILPSFVSLFSCRVLSDILCLKNCCFIYFVQFFSCFGWEGKPISCYSMLAQVEAYFDILSNVQKSQNILRYCLI